MYLVAPNMGTYYLFPEETTPIDTFGGRSFVIDYKGRIVWRQDYGAGSTYVGGVIDIEALSLPKTPLPKARDSQFQFTRDRFRARCRWSISQVAQKRSLWQKQIHEARVFDYVAYRHSRNETASGCSSLIAMMQPTYLR